MSNKNNTRTQKPQYPSNTLNRIDPSSITSFPIRNPLQHNAFIVSGSVGIRREEEGAEREREAKTMYNLSFYSKPRAENWTKSVDNGFARAPPVLMRWFYIYATYTHTSNCAQVLLLLLLPHMFEPHKTSFLQIS